MQKVRILFLIPTLMNGGAERVLVNLVNNLDYRVFDVHLKTIMNVGDLRFELNPQINYTWIFDRLVRGSRLFFNIFSPKHLYDKYIGDGYDILVSYLEGSTARIISGCTNANVKKIAWIHIEMNKYSQFSMGFRNKFEAKKCYNAFDEVICVSKSVKESFEKISGIINKCRVLYNTIDTERIKRLSKEGVYDLKVDNREVNICSVAKIEYSKGYDRLASIHKKLLQEGIKNHIYIIGSGKEKDRITNFITRNGLTASFEFLGFKSNPYKYMALCDLYVCSSRREGFSTAVTEALVLGLPVVSTSCSGAYELLGENNEYGIVTENNEDSLFDGMKLLLTNPELLNKYRLKSQIRGERFSIEDTVNRTTQILLSK